MWKNRKIKQDIFHLQIIKVVSSFENITLIMVQKLMQAFNYRLNTYIAQPTIGLQYTYIFFWLKFLHISYLKKKLFTSKKTLD